MWQGCECWEEVVTTLYLLLLYTQLPTDDEDRGCCQREGEGSGMFVCKLLWGLIVVDDRRLGKYNNVGEFQHKL